MMAENAILTYFTQFIFIGFGILSLVDFLRFRGYVRRDIALMIASLAGTILLQLINRALNLESSILATLGSLLLISQPYLMLRLVTHFSDVPVIVKRATNTGLLVSWAAVGIYRSDLPFALKLLIVFYFVIADGYAMLAFIRGTWITSGIVQKRLRFTATGSGLFALALLMIGMAVAIPALRSIAVPIMQLTAIASALAYYIGLSTPRWLKQTWQLKELRGFLAQMMTDENPATSAEIYEFLCHGAIDTTGAVRAVVAHRNDRSSDWTLHHANDTQNTCTLSSAGIIERTWHKQTMVAILSSELDADEKDCLQPANANLIYIVPSRANKQTELILFVFLEHGVLFVDDDLHILSLFVEQCEIVLENIGLVEELQQQAAILEERVEQRTLELKRQKTYISLLQQVTAAGNEATTIDGSLQQAIKLICEGLDLSLGHAFARMEDAPSTIVSSSIWHLTSPEKYEAFRKATDNTIFVEGSGNIGQIIREGVPQWFTNLAEQSDYSRAEVAKELGIQTGIFIPVFVEYKVVVILEFYSDQLLESDEDLLEIMLQIGIQLGRVIERKRVEAAVRDAKERFRALFETAPVAIVIIDSEGKLLMSNEKTLEIFGYEESELLGQKLELLLPQRLQSIHVKHRQQYFSSLQSRPMGVGSELVGRRSDSTEFPIELGLSYIKIEAGILAVAFISDISEQKRAAEALHESEGRYHNMIDNMIEGFQIIGSDWCYLYVNDSAAQYGRIPKEDLLGYTLMEKYPGIEQTEMFATLNECMEERITKRTEFEFAYPDGSSAWFKFSIQPVLEGISILSLDITERKHDENAIKQLNKELGQRVEERTTHLLAVNKELEAFSYSVSHDLRAPLRAIDGFSQALLEDYKHRLDDEGQEYLHLIRTECQQMGQLIDDLIELSRYTRSEIKYKNVDLSAMVWKITQVLQKQEPQRQVQFIVADAVSAYGDEALLRIVLQNLLSNAWKYTSKQSEVRIEFGCTYENAKTEYFVCDNGVGFNMAYVHKLFGAFQRLHARNEFQGTGIGLATVQRIIHRHGGTVRAEAAIDQGATFYFTLATEVMSNEQNGANYITG
jgi:PAS domain S-box-containing protein